MKKIGDLFLIKATGEFYPAIECIIMEISPDDGRVLKAKAATPDERLGKVGFIQEGDDYIIVEWEWTSN